MLSKYHLEAAIAYWHTQKKHPDKWQEILTLYNKLLQIEYSPVAALNRTYAYAKVHGNNNGIMEAGKINLQNHHLYHCLLGEFYKTIDSAKSLKYFETALTLAKTDTDKKIIRSKIENL